jgi:HD-GYP domain-containing protein (c-di-GMP phosphodiesterase class II)
MGVADVSASGPSSSAVRGLVPARFSFAWDAYDTITSERTYKNAHNPEEAFLELERCGGAQFELELLRTFVSRLRQLPAPLIEQLLVNEREVLS